MKTNFQAIDWGVLIGYFILTMGVGFYFYRRTRTSEGYTAANRSLPGWVLGLSIFATYLSSISYLALPGRSFAGNWNPFVFSLSIPLVAWMAVRYFVPYYRRGNEVSGYALLEKRFGLWARLYASTLYLLIQVARIGVVLYLMALPMQVIFGWNIYAILIVTGVCVTIYSFVGGIVAVIWADAIQALVLMAGALLCLAVMLFDLPGGVVQVFEVGQIYEKFSLGEFSSNLTIATFWVVLLYGMASNLKAFGIDQSYIQRYVSASSDKEARRSIWLGSILYVPVSALFLFIGSTLFVFYGEGKGSEKHPELEQMEFPGNLDDVMEVVVRQRLMNSGVGPGHENYEIVAAEVRESLELIEVGDRVFPHFIATHLPPGVTGLLIAAVFAAAMSTVSTSMNSSATLIMSDFYRRFIKSRATEKQIMRVLYVSTVVWGGLGTGMALLLVKLTESALDMWWTLSGIFGGGLSGLFLLGLISRRAGNPAAITGVVLGIVVITWLTLPTVLPGLEALIHPFLIPVFGLLTILLTGMAISFFQRKGKKV